jgi:GNAT superfamily N-acetyltransferase
MSMKIKELTSATYTVWAQMRVGLWGQSEPEIYADYEQYRTKRRSGQAYIILALTDEGDCVGFIESELRRDHVEGVPTRPVWYVEGIYVAPAARKKGVGRFLVSVLESHARAEGYAAIASDCEFDDTDSESFHKTVGFTEVLRDIHLVKILDRPPKSIPEALYGSIRPPSAGLEGEIDVRCSVEQDRDWLFHLFKTHWSDTTVACRGRVIDLFQAQTKVACLEGVPVGVINYIPCIENHEIVSVISEVPRLGIGRLLALEVESDAREAGCPRLTAVTTNDNTDAFRFWQRQGFRVVGVSIDGVTEARCLKPSIPEVGQSGIPIRDEIILSKVLY